MCNCGPDVTIGGYQNNVSLDIPRHMHKYRDNRLAAGLSGRICVDVCLVEEIKALWFAGIKTTGCCCGHNQQVGYIGVFPEYIEQMKSMGYQVAFNNLRPLDEDSFIPKTVEVG